MTAIDLPTRYLVALADNWHAMRADVPADEVIAAGVGDTATTALLALEMAYDHGNQARRANLIRAAVLQVAKLAKVNGLDVALVPSPPPGTARIVRLVAEGTFEELAGWEIRRVLAGKTNVLSGPAPAACFASTVVATNLNVPVHHMDRIGITARRLQGRARLSVGVVVQPDEWIFYCLNCGASVWQDNDGMEHVCSVCGGWLGHYEPRAFDAGPWGAP